MPNDPFVDVAALRSLGPVRYLDTRDQAAFDAGHLPGAVRVRLEEWDAAAEAADTGFNKTAKRRRSARELEDVDRLLAGSAKVNRRRPTAGGNRQ